MTRQVEAAALNNLICGIKRAPAEVSNVGDTCGRDGGGGAAEAGSGRGGGRH